VGPFDDLVAQADEKLRQIEQVQQQFERAEVTGHSRNNGVSARMRGNGQVIDVVIDPRILERFDAKAVGGFVTEAVNDALRRLNEANQALWAPLMAEVDLETA
jgi:DNA-binding protein YbaB